MVSGEDKITFEVFDQEFQNAIREAAEECSDLRIPFGLITESWFKSNRAIFSLAGPGKYADLAPSTKIRKAREFGKAYPILRATGALERSITVPGTKDSISKTINKKSLVLGSSVPYGKFHQYGTKKMPKRPFVLLGAEQTAPSALNKRRELWIGLIRDHVESMSRKAFE